MAKTFLEIFREINRIPRPSHHEEKIAQFLCDFAQEHGLKFRKDQENCVWSLRNRLPQVMKMLIQW